MNQYHKLFDIFLSCNSTAVFNALKAAAEAVRDHISCAQTGVSGNLCGHGDHPPGAKQPRLFFMAETEWSQCRGFKSCAFHLGHTLSDYPHCSWGWQDKWIGMCSFYPASFSAGLSGVSVLSTIREDPCRLITLFQGQTHDWLSGNTPCLVALCCTTPSFHLQGGERLEIKQ